ncbi:MAG TPA: MBL fold metallo-hydrolase [Actinomycetota bacterium]|nr:MBL fold metallo-hydrolase [Actinomycetota bacterium]
MQVDLFDRNPYGTNCWLLSSDGGEEAVVVDPGFDAAGIGAHLERAGSRAVAVLLTHAHLDHASEAGVLAGDDVPVFVHADDAIAFEDLERWNPGFDNPLSPVKDLRTIEDGELLTLGGLRVRVHHTPGHTPGHCSFEIEDVLAGGDLVFAGTVGRSDFPNSSPDDMARSLRWLLTLDDAVEVLPGHGNRTTVGRERASNPYLVGLR